MPGANISPEFSKILQRNIARENSQISIFSYEFPSVNVDSIGP
jgi:hypothetical protein